MSAQRSRQRQGLFKINGIAATQTTQCRACQSFAGDIRRKTRDGVLDNRQTDATDGNTVAGVYTRHIEFPAGDAHACVTAAGFEGGDFSDRLNDSREHMAMNCVK
jgi:hypothetical protein